MERRSRRRRGGGNGPGRGDGGGNAGGQRPAGSGGSSSSGGGGRGRRRRGRGGGGSGGPGRNGPGGQRPTHENRAGGQSTSGAGQFEPSGELTGVLEAPPDGGVCFLRDPARHLVPSAGDPDVDRALIQQVGLRGGEMITGQIGAGRNGRPRSRLLRVLKVGDVPVEEWKPPPSLADSTAIDPEQRIHFDTPGGPPSMRILELFTPVGFGQRALIVAPPRTGKTMLLQQIAHGITVNHPEAYMMVLLIDERPEEVTEMRRNVRGEVIASSNDLNVESHVRVARLVIERSRRLVEAGKHVVVLLDSITRLGRAFNSFVGSSGRTMTGGLDIRALTEPRQMFAAARNIEHGGSLTIIATALVQTGSRADDFIFQEFKGTGNMELVLDRELAEMRLWPAINLQQSGTRKEEKLYPPEDLAKIHYLRRFLFDQPVPKRMPLLLDKMGRYETLQQFLDSLQAR